MKNNVFFLNIKNTLFFILIKFNTFAQAIFFTVLLMVTVDELSNFFKGKIRLKVARNIKHNVCHDFDPYFPERLNRSSDLNEYLKQVGSLLKLLHGWARTE